MNRTPMKRRGKGARERTKGMDKHTPYLCERAGGVWLGFKVPKGEPHSDGCQCEICGAYIGDVWGHRAHINERKGPADDNIWNLIVAGPCCHDHDAFSDGGLRCGTAEALRIVKEKNEQMGIRRE